MAEILNDTVQSPVIESSGNWNRSWCYQLQLWLKKRDFYFLNSFHDVELFFCSLTFFFSLVYFDSSLFLVWHQFPESSASELNVKKIFLNPVLFDLIPEGLRGRVLWLLLVGNRMWVWSKRAASVCGFENRIWQSILIASAWDPHYDFVPLAAFWVCGGT